MMGRFWVRGLVSISACVTIGSVVYGNFGKVIAQPAKSEELYYFYFDQKIPLKIQQDVIVVEGKPKNQLSGSESYARTLKRYLRGGGTLSGDDNSNPPGVEIDSIGNQYALVGFSSAAKQAQIQKEIKAEPNLNATLPVLSMGDRSSVMLVLPNRIVVSFKADISTRVVQETLNRLKLEIIRKETFADGVYLVRSKVATGTTILQVANQLRQEVSVDYATPDFIQIPASSKISPSNQTTENKRSTKLIDIIRSLSPDQYSPTSPRLLPLQWNLDSAPLNQCLTPASNTWNCLFKKSPSEKSATVKRTDIRAREAWKVSDRKGRGVVVAVIDAFVQSDHTDLVPSVYQVDNPQCPKETYGWDFTNDTDHGPGCQPGDPEPAIDSQEAEDLRVKLLDSLNLSDSELAQKYPTVLKEVGDKRKIRNYLRGQITSSFHGTNVAGVIAASSSKGEGLVGVAPNAKILPLRVFGLIGSLQDVAIPRAIRYAAEQKVDIINLSLGSKAWVNEPMVRAIEKALADNPNLVIVASAGNHAEDFPGLVMPPACIPGMLSVGATNLLGRRSTYSNFGSADWPTQYTNAKLPCGIGLKTSFQKLEKDDASLDVVAPGGDIYLPGAVEGMSVGGVFTTGGTSIPGLWRGLSIQKEDYPFEHTLDQRGKYIWTDGTSFSAPAVAGVIALMKAEDPERKLTRQQLVTILKQTASYENLEVGEDIKQYNESKQKGILPAYVSPNQYFFGAGLVNAEAAVREVKRQLGRN
jgi:serine protease